MHRRPQTIHPPPKPGPIRFLTATPTNPIPQNLGTTQQHEQTSQLSTIIIGKQTSCSPSGTKPLFP
jgi:hypothetical protein